MRIKTQKCLTRVVVETVCIATNSKSVHTERDSLNAPVQIVPPVPPVTARMKGSETEQN